MNSSLHKLQLNPENSEIRCRICYDVTFPLLSLCECSGSIAFVHEECILDWISKKMQSSQYVEIPHCQICKGKYSARLNVGKKKLSLTMLTQKIRALTSLQIIKTIFFLISFIIGLYSISSTIVKVMARIAIPQENWITILFVHVVFPLFFCYLSARHLRQRKRLAEESTIQVVEVILQPKMILK